MREIVICINHQSYSANIILQSIIYVITTEFGPLTLTVIGSWDILFQAVHLSSIGSEH